MQSNAQEERRGASLSPLPFSLTETPLHFVHLGPLAPHLIAPLLSLATGILFESIATASTFCSNVPVIAPLPYLAAGITSENVAAQYGVSREVQDTFAAASHAKAAAAQVSTVPSQKQSEAPHYVLVGGEGWSN